MWSGHGARREPVVRRDAHPAALREVRHERLGLTLLLSHHPRAAVHLEQHRRFGVIGKVGALPHVEPVASTGVAVADVACGAIALARSHVGTHQLPPRQGNLELWRERFTDAASVVGSEFVDQRRLEDAVRLARCRVDRHEPGNGCGVGGETELAAPSRRPTATGQQRPGRELRQTGLQRQLRRHEPEGEGRHGHRARARRWAKGIRGRGGCTHAGDQEAGRRFHPLRVGTGRRLAHTRS